MDAGAIAGCFRDKSILITGSTGFLGKVLVEKMLRVQPDVRKLYLLVRAPDAASAEQRVYTEVLGNDLFNTLREKHGPGFQSFIKEKLVPLAGDIIYADFGLEKSVVYELSEKIDVIVNVAATTNFYERYDVALTSNVLGARHACEFAKKCTNLKMLLHVSTAYVAGEQEGLILERPFLIGEAMKAGTILDIEAEFKLVDKMKMELVQHSDHGRLHQLEKAKMKDLGMNRAKHFGWPNAYVFTKAMGEMLLGHLRGDLPVVIVRPSMVSSIYRDPLPGWIQGTRTIDTLIDGYGKRALPCFIGEDNVVLDVIPGDMVVNAMMVAMVTHWNEHAQIIYHVSSSLRNPLTYSTFVASMYHYFSAKLRLEKTGRTIQYKRLFLFNKYVHFYVYMFLLYRLPLETFHILSAGLLSERYNRQKRSYYLTMLTAKFYAPYAFFKGCFDDSNAERLRVVTGKNDKKTDLFDFDPRSIDWDMYFYCIHIPGLLKYAKKEYRTVTTYRTKIHSSI